MAEEIKRPLVIVGSTDFFLSTNLGRIITAAGLRCVRTNQMERIELELKKPGRVFVGDLKWEELQERGVLKKLVNVGAICGNKVFAICPNDDEELKVLAKKSRVKETFIRYDIENRFKVYMELL
ncbi:MAG: hypothetical protein KDD53_05505 [Bdellovibrionales bacterium]|nr:hypothetical protein [Bdellovibrionales bacterium]